MASRSRVTASIPHASASAAHIVPVVMPANTNHIPPARDTGALSANLTTFVKELACLAAQMYRDGRLSDSGTGQE